MIIDIVPAFNEVELFQIRYHELKPFVNKFVIIESTHTHAGNEKPLYFTEWLKTQQCDISAEVVIFDATNFAPLTNEYAWMRENAQREMARLWVERALNSGAIPEDAEIMLSDMDEIPRADCLNTYPALNHGIIYACEQDLSYLYLNTRAGKWNGTKLSTAATIENLPRMGVQSMTMLMRYAPDVTVIPNCGWHFSSCGGFDRVRHKFNNYAHTEMQYEQPDERIRDSLVRVVDPFHGNPLEVVGLDVMPTYVQENIQFFKDKGFWYVRSV